MDKKKIIKFLILNTLISICFSLTRPITPALLHDKGSMDSLNGILFSFTSLGMVITSPLWGKYVDKIGPKRLMIVAPLIYGLTQLMLGFSPGAFGMSVASLLVGCFSAGWVVIGYVYINKYSDEKSKTKYFGYIVVSVSLAGIIGQLTSGFLGTHIDIYDLFILQFILILITVTLLYIFIEKFTVEDAKDLEKRKKEIVEKEILAEDNREVLTEKNVEKEKNFMQHFKILQKEGMLYLLIVLLFFSLARSSYFSQIGYFVSDTLRRGTLSVGFINAYTNLIMLISNYFLVARLENHFGSLRFLRVEFILSIIGISILYFSNGFFALIPITIFLIGIVMGRPVIQKILVSKSSLESSEILGYATSANALGLVLGSFFGGILYQIHPRNVLLFILLILILGTITLFFTTKLLRKKKA